MRITKRAGVFAVLGSLAVLAAACGSSTKKSDAGTTTTAASSATTAAATTTTGGAATTAPAATTTVAATTTAPAKKGGTLVFGTSADPVVLDGAYVSDGESLRVVKQIFETLVTTKPGGTDIAPLLATDWKASADGLSWTFTLRSGVTFQDGTAFNAKAVCTNFDRWYHFTGIQQSEAVAYYWDTVFGGYSDGKTPSLYKDCVAASDTSVTIDLTKPSAAFLAGLANPAFSIASPDALTKYEADKVSGTADSPKFDGTFGTQHPVGTGPFKLDSWKVGEELDLVRYDGYWGTKAILDKVVFKPIADGPARRQALESGEIQAYDLVDPADIGALTKAGFQMLKRPAFNVGYVGFNISKAPLDNPQIRQAIAYALNREALVKAKYPEGAEVATQFQPPQLFGWSADVPKYDYNPDKAKELIKASGVTNPTIEFWYPSAVSRPYMPDPTANFEAFKADLEAVGFKVVPKTAPWRGGYLDTVNSGGAQVYLLGWTGDYGDPDNFDGVFFRDPNAQFGTDKAPLTDIEKALATARDTSDLTARTAMYKTINAQIMTALPGVPYVHTEPTLAFAKNVTGYVPSPVGNEDFSTVSVG